MMKKFLLFSVLCMLYHVTNAQEVSPLGKALYLEVAGKGFVSANVDLPLAPKDRLTLGLTILDHEFEKENPADENYPTYTLPTPSVMYFHLFGKEKHYFETGAGVSISPIFWKAFSEHDSPISLHASLGYRYQAPHRFFFRAGLTPFYRINWMFLPLVGASAGYSW